MKAGLIVVPINDGEFCWLGKPERLQDAGIFPTEKRISSKCQKSLSSVEGVSARIIWLVVSGEVFVRLVFSLETSKQAQNQTLRRAAADAGYQKFRVAMLQPVDEIDAE